MLELFSSLGPNFPNYHFIAPNGFYSCACSNIDNDKYQMFVCGDNKHKWFIIDLNNMEAMLTGIQRIQSKLKGLIETQLQKLGLNYSDLILIGHSQGSILALYLTYYVLPQCGATIAYAGTLPINKIPSLHPITQLNSTPVILVHGKKDGIIPYTESVQTNLIIKELGGNSQVVILDNDDHGITESGLDVINQFLNKV